MEMHNHYVIAISAIFALVFAIMLISLIRYRKPGGGKYRSHAGQRLGNTGHQHADPVVVGRHRNLGALGIAEGPATATQAGAGADRPAWRRIHITANSRVRRSRLHYP